MTATTSLCTTSNSFLNLSNKCVNLSDLKQHGVQSVVVEVQVVLTVPKHDSCRCFSSVQEKEHQNHVCRVADEHATYTSCCWG